MTDPSQQNRKNSDREMVRDWRKAFSRPAPAIALVVYAVVVFSFFSSFIPTYFTVDDYNFVGELLVNARHYVQGELLHRWFIEFSAQGLQNPELSIFFRPGVHWLWLNDFTWWGTFAPGYHVTNVSLHVLNAFLVSIFAWLILRHRMGAFAAGLLFALQPVHVTAVALASNRVDLLSAFFYLTSAIYFVLYRQRSRTLFRWVSVGSFALAIVTKESTVALPLVLFAYDCIFVYMPGRWEIGTPGFRREKVVGDILKIARAQIPYWVVLVGYVGLRFLSFGEFGRNPGGGFVSFGWGLFLQFYAMAMAQPFISDMNNGVLLIVLALAALVLVIYRKRKEMWFGFLWIVISLIPLTLVANVAPRLAYTPSVGLPIALAAIIIQPLARPTNWSRALGLALMILVTLSFGFGFASQIDDWTAVGRVASAVTGETQRLHPTLPHDARLYYVGVPDILRGIYIYNDNFVSAIRIAYADPSLWAERVEKFPVLTDNLDRTFFLEYSRRVITQRDDLIRVLQTRQQCPAAQQAVLNWDFSRENTEWQAWNQLASLQTRDGALVMQSSGADPNFGSPTLALPTLTVGQIEVDMSVRAETPTAQGAILWTTTGQDDFSPAQQRTFDVQADGTFHTYRVDIARDSNLMIGDNVTRLRLDPIRAPGEIALKAIRINAYCAQIDGGTCKCQ